MRLFMDFHRRVCCQNSKEGKENEKNRERLPYVQTGLVPRFPTAIFCVGTMLLAAMTLGFGYLLHAETRARVEAKRLAYLSYQSVSGQNIADRNQV